MNSRVLTTATPPPEATVLDTMTDRRGQVLYVVVLPRP